ncbi:unnamed protein product [Victoria cruziana]
MRDGGMVLLRHMSNSCQYQQALMFCIQSDE